MSRVYEAMRRLGGNAPDKAGVREGVLEDFARDEASQPRAAGNDDAEGGGPKRASVSPISPGTLPVDAATVVAEERPPASRAGEGRGAARRNLAADETTFHTFMRPTDDRSFQDLILDIAQDEWEQSMEDR